MSKIMKALLAGIAAVALASLGIVSAGAQGLAPGSSHWYAPEHEKYGRTAFYALPSFRSAMVRVTRAQQFRLHGATNGWAEIEFETAGKAYVHLRILRTLVYDPGASDPWYEFQRASVFSEDPRAIETRLKGASAAPPAAGGDPKTPAWKRYKEAWGLKPSRPASSGNADDASADPSQAAARAIPGTAAGKPRSKYPLLPPIGADANQDAAPPDASGGEPAAAR